MITKISNKLLDLIFNFYVNTALIIIAWSISKKNDNNKSAGIMALPYYSENYPGGSTRIANWKEYFQRDGIVFDVYWASESHNFLSCFYSQNPFKRYFFFIKVFNSRLKLIRKIKNYKVIWVQRAFIPFYPFKEAIVEKLIKKINPNIIFDFYDADYASNYNLTIDSAKMASKVTVASIYLQNYFNKINPRTELVPFAMNFEDYKKKEYLSKSKIVIGWMGSPDNFKNVLDIQDSLVQIENRNPQVQFVFICRDEFKLKLNNVRFKKWSDKQFNYHEEISLFDIGISPVIQKSEDNYAKTTFKVLEFMSSGVAFVSSPLGIPDKIVHQKNALIADNEFDWIDCLQSLIDDFELRKKLGGQAFKTISGEYSYSKIYKQLNKILSFK